MKICNLLNLTTKQNEKAEKKERKNERKKEKECMYRNMAVNCINVHHRPPCKHSIANHNFTFHSMRMPAKNRVTTKVL